MSPQCLALVSAGFCFLGLKNQKSKRSAGCRSLQIGKPTSFFGRIDLSGNTYAAVGHVISKSIGLAISDNDGLPGRDFIVYSEGVSAMVPAASCPADSRSSL